MAEGTSCNWKYFVATFAEVTGQQASYQQVIPQEMIAGMPDKAFGEELADMFFYPTDPGYDGGMHLLRAGRHDEGRNQMPGDHAGGVYEEGGILLQCCTSNGQITCRTDKPRRWSSSRRHIHLG